MPCRKLIALVCAGCIGGSGGKVLHDMVRAGYNMSKGADEVSVPGTSLHSSFVGVVTYYLLVIANPVLTGQQGYVLVTLLLVRLASVLCVLYQQQCMCLTCACDYMTEATA